MFGLSIGFLLAYVVKLRDESDRVPRPPADAVKSAGKVSRSGEAVRVHQA
jgi:hypothetical protein